MASVKLPATVDVPISIVGSTSLTTSARPTAVAFPVAALRGWAGVWRLVIAQAIAHIVCEQPGQVYAPEMPNCILFGQTFTHHGIAQLVGNADSRRSRTKDHHALPA
jgi:hypothetical protein